ncbi:3'-5' exonuclease [Uliginosibacterium sp. 31-12]|uniref:3'-5' exonuclease n=1 Tax=Uliginosibacterium sp. 31-12 TaxID=3062781 RepID=UPI0026E3658A|nr:3'-5' exonuclease [Uliginosibacterium sp. 31-12]MDO6388010.1 3'-5' exonuclease [Uliginosibacterium sp. 31-12]
MNLLNRLSRWRARRALRDPAYAFLFTRPPANEWISIDCETSSLDPQQAEILSIAAVPVRANRIYRSEALRLMLKPEGSIAPGSIPIHQLRAQDLADGLSVDQALPLLLEFIGARPLLGYYLEFDLAVLNRQIQPRLGIHLPNPAIEVSGLYYDRKVTAYRPEVDLRLSSILQDLDLPDLPRHDPLNDAVLAAMIFLKLSRMTPDQDSEF